MGERKLKGWRAPIPVTPDYNPATQSLAKVLLEQAGLPTGSTTEQVTPESFPLENPVGPRKRRKFQRRY